MSDLREINVRNVSEPLVEMFLVECMEKAGMCTCSRCQADVLALALNEFPPHYVVSDFGDMMTRAMSLSNQFRADIITAIMKGIIVVKDFPRH